MSRPINLALQGGGAHGAFTWGVLDRFLDADGPEIAGISGTSAGALNGAALKAGLNTGDREAARANLDWLWTRAGGLADERLAAWLSELAPPTGILSALIESSPAYLTLDAITRVASPYARGLADNPLRPIVDRFRFDEVRAPHGPALFICATNVRSGKIRVFSGAEITTDAILASACLPTLFRAVEIEKDGVLEAYWDGGYTGNPALFPLFAPSLPDDIVIVNINPLVRERVPRTPQEIVNRINEISFNSSLLRELRAIRFVQDLLERGVIAEGAMKHVKVHMISDDALMNDLGVATKTLPTPVILSRLKAAGRSAADRFLARHGDDLGRGSTIDLPETIG